LQGGESFDLSEAAQRSLERCEDELTILRIRYEQQSKGFDEAKFAEDGKSGEDSEGAGLDLASLRYEEMTVRRCMEEEAGELVRAEEEGRERMIAIQAELRSNTAALVAIGRDVHTEKADVANHMTVLQTLSDKYRDITTMSFPKTRQDIISYLRSLDLAATKARRGGEGYVESIQAIYEEKSRKREMLSDELQSMLRTRDRSQGSGFVDSEAREDQAGLIEDLSDELQTLDAELDLLKMSIIEASRRDSRSGSRGGVTESFFPSCLPVGSEGLMKEIECLDKLACRDLVQLLTRIILDLRAEDVEFSVGEALGHEEISALLRKSEAARVLCEQTLNEQRVEYESKLAYLVQQLRQAEEHRRTSLVSSEVSRLKSPMRSISGKLRDTPQKRGESSPRGPSANYSSEGEIDMARVVARWKSEALRRQQLELRNGELLREIRQLRGETTDDPPVTQHTRDPNDG
jgi:hypothetical protein